MPRTARPWEVGGIYHVDAVAHGGLPIFATDEDRRFVLVRAAKVFRELGVICLAYAIQINHYHFVLICRGPPGRAVLRLNTAIARRVRLRGGRGAVFQGRFFSGLCADEASLLLRFAYVTANAVHHRVVPSIEALISHRWSSLGEVLGVRPALLVEPRAALDLFADAHPSPEVALLAFLESRARAWAGRGGDPDRDDDPDLEAAQAAARSVRVSRRLADEAAVPRTIGEIEGPLPAIAGDWDGACARRELLRAAGWTPADLAAEVCRATGADALDLREGCRAPAISRARAIVAHIACDDLAWSSVEVAAVLRISPSAVNQARRKGRAVLDGLGLSAAVLLERSRRPTDRSTESASPAS
jgi:hypothetical protein